MTVRVFYTDAKPAHDIREPNYKALMPFIFDTPEMAIAHAMKLIQNGAIVWRIEGPDDFLLSRTEIEDEYWRQTGRRPSV